MKIVLCFVDDIKKYAESRFRIAREVCETVIDSLDKMGDEAELRFVKLSLFAIVFLFLIINDMTVLCFFQLDIQARGLSKL